MVLIFDTYAVSVTGLGLAQFPYCWANCGTVARMKMSLWHNPWQYLRTRYTSLIFLSKDASGTCHTRHPFRTLKKGAWMTYLS